MNISYKGIEFIKGWEDFKSKAYKDIAGVWTIGYGTTSILGIKIKRGDTITEIDAMVELMIECNGLARRINSFVNHQLKEHEFDALCSLSYNIGAQGFKTSTLLKQINARAPISVDYFTRWNKITVDGKLVPSAGLLRRRLTEYQLFKFANYAGNR